MSPDLVERVTKVITGIVETALDHDQPIHPAIARWALALAERAAREAECGHVGMAAVQRAVEGA